MKLTVIIIALMSIVSFSAIAVEKPTIEERLIRLEEGQKRLNQRLEDTNKRIDDLRQEMNQRFGDINQRFGDINQRFEDTNKRIADLQQYMNQRFDDLRFWLQIALGMLVLIIAGLVGQFLLIWRRLVKVESKVEDHLAETEKNRLIAFQREEIEMLKARLDKLEAQ
ncbi:MAG: hypothetical protein ACE5PV_09320 [Candidatus Poribacteria bacterium]